MIGCLRTRVRNQPIIALYFESENVLKLYNLEARFPYWHQLLISLPRILTKTIYEPRQEISNNVVFSHE